MRSEYLMKLFATALVASIGAFPWISRADDDLSNFKVVQGVAIYFGVMPAEIAGGHPKEHPEASMHGGPPAKGHRDHVVVALFDNATGRRIEDAEVTGSVMEIGLASQQKKLERMTIAGTVTYGNYFNMPSNDSYHIRLRILRPGMSGAIEATFTHKHFGR